MYEHRFFLEEKRKIDELLQNDCHIVNVTENLSGAYVTFRRSDEASDDFSVTEHLLTADARRYMTNVLFAQRLKQSMTGS